MGIFQSVGAKGQRLSLNYTIITDSCQLSEIEAVFSFCPCPELSNYREIPNFGPESGPPATASLNKL
jgi:hypothetical protein